MFMSQIWMKKTVIVLLATVMIISTACNNKEVKEETSKTAIAENNDGYFVVSGNDDFINNPESETPKVEGEKTENIKTEKTKDNNITIAIPNKDLTGFSSVTDVVLGKNKIDSIINCLKQNNVLPSNIKTPSIKIKNKKAEVNFFSEFGNLLMSVGSTGEYYIMGSIVNSIIDNYGVNKVKIICNDKKIETGHNIYDKYMKRYKDK